jgi:hypothetical protein
MAYVLQVLCVHTSLINDPWFKEHHLVLKMTIYPPIYLRSMPRFLGEIPNMITISLNLMVYFYTLYPFLYLK